MQLPEQIQKDIAELEALEKQMKGRQPAGDEPEVDDETSEQEPAPVAEAKPDEPVAEEQPPAPAKEKPSKPSEDFEQKYRSLRGKYDAEVPRLHQEVKALTAQIEELRKAQEKPEPEPEPKRYVTDADKEAFGEDLLEASRRVAMEVAEQYQAKISSLEKHIENLESKLTETGGQIGAVSFEQQLRAAVPDFDQVNRDPRWVAWLDEHDPIVRGPRRQMAQQAFNAGDAEAVADYVKLFKRTLEQPPQQSDRSAELERQVAPKRTASATPPPGQKPAAKIYTESQANALWDRVRDMSMRQQYDEAAKLEAELSAAYVEGRVRPG